MIAIVLKDYDAAFLYNCWFLFIIVMGLLIYKYAPLWQEVSVKSLILRWLLRPVGLLLHWGHRNKNSLFIGCLNLSDGEHHIWDQGHKPEVDLGFWDRSPSRRSDREGPQSLWGALCQSKNSGKVREVDTPLLTFHMYVHNSRFTEKEVGSKPNLEFYQYNMLL